MKHLIPCWNSIGILLLELGLTPALAATDAPTTTVTFEKYVSASDGGDNDEFGHAVALSGDGQTTVVDA
jgi:hypothetical protein